METVVKIFCVFLLAFYASSLPLEKVEPRAKDLQAGTKGGSDVLLKSYVSAMDPSSYSIIRYVLLNTECTNMTYVTATEKGNFSDASSELIEGGPGFNYVLIALTPGPLNGFNYTMELYGPNKVCV